MKNLILVTLFTTFVLTSCDNRRRTYVDDGYYQSPSGNIYHNSTHNNVIVTKPRSSMWIFEKPTRITRSWSGRPTVTNRNSPSWFSGKSSRSRSSSSSSPSRRKR